MDYEMEELVPVVRKLAEKYTGHESTSVTYETAEQLMGAVLYCIAKLQEKYAGLPVLSERIPAQKAYDIGAEYVKEKTEDALKRYNGMLSDFCHYENQCLYDTFVKGIPEFFKWYDIRFEPQNTILTLDYPVLRDISEYTGIDKIYAFMQCIALEQKFLKLFPADYVRNILSKNNSRWQESIENICETVLIYVTGHLLAGKNLTEFQLEAADYSYIRALFRQTPSEDIRKRLEMLLKLFTEKHCENDKDLMEYLSYAIDDMVVRFKNAADHQVLDRLI